MRSVHFIHIVLVIMTAFCTQGCFWGGKKRMNERVTLRYKDKIPYGCWYAYEHIGYLFPNATVEPGKNSPDLEDASDKGNTLYVIISPKIFPGEGELDELKNFVSKGNHLFLSAINIDTALLEAFGLRTAYSPDVQTDNGITAKLVNPIAKDTLSYSYPGFNTSYFVSSYDSFYTRVQGYSGNNKPDFIQVMNKNGGTVSLHTNPYTFTNFFLLHKQNKAYFDQVFSKLQPDIERVIWDDYFRNAGSANSFSALNVILANSSLRWAMILAILILLLLLFSEMKRRQRVIPLKEPLVNSSLDFVTTVGRLYFQRKDNHDLVLKMLGHFKEFIRHRYNLSNMSTSPDFIRLLALKSGLPEVRINDLLSALALLEADYNPDDESVLELNRQLEKFYKNES